MIGVGEINVRVCACVHGGGMKRSERIEDLVQFIGECPGKYLRYQLVRVYSYKTGISTRTIEDYLGVLFMVGKVAAVDHKLVIPEG